MSRVFSIADIKLPLAETYRLWCHRFGTGDGPRVTVVAGVHGDEFNGLGVCYQLTSWLGQLEKEQPGALRGTVDVLPSVNALALDSGRRYWPGYEADLNRRFPGNAHASPPQRVPAALLEFLTGSALCVDIHASNIYLQEVPQVRMLEAFAPRLVPLAEHINMEIIWLHAASTVLETTLSYNLNGRGVPTLVVEMGIGLRYEDGVCSQLFAGILALLVHLGVVDADALSMTERLTPRVTPRVVRDRDVHYLNAARSGFFVPAAALWEPLQEGHLIGTVVSPLQGTVLEEMRAPFAGRLFTTRPFPMVYEGSLCGRLLAEDATHA